MKKEIVVNSTPNEIRIGIVEDNELVELLGDSADSTRMVGNVYKGRVTAVRPGLQAAFVDIGYEKAGFLHVSDLIHEEPEDAKSDHSRDRRRGRNREGMRPIERMIREGDEILVQVVKEALGTKGPRLTADISLPGRFLVLMPKGKHVGVSRKIGDHQERARLKAMLSSVRPDKGAFIIRTAGEGIDEKMLRKDVEYLTEILGRIEERAKEVSAPAIVHEDVGLIVGLIRDVLTEDVDAVYIDNEVDYKRLVEYVKTFSPGLLNRIKLYRGDVSLFDKFDIESELKKSLEHKVWMKKGGYIVIDQTEALVAIDVNTGRFTGKRNQEETIFKTNMMAAREVPRQLRLRNIGGIVVIDFIDMESESNKKKVLNELRTYLKRDRARTKTFAVSDLGLIEMSRQRVRASLQSRLSDACPFCKGSGYVLSLETLANKVERLLSKCGLATHETAIQVQANPSLAVHLLMDRGAAIEKIARDFNMKIDILDDARIHREDFKIVSLRSRKDLTSQLENAAWKGTVSRRPAAVAQAGATDERSSSRRSGRDRGRSDSQRDWGRGSGRRSRDSRREGPPSSAELDASRGAADRSSSRRGSRRQPRRDEPVTTSEQGHDGDQATRREEGRSTPDRDNGRGGRWSSRQSARGRSSDRRRGSSEASSPRSSTSRNTVDSTRGTRSQGQDSKAEEALSKSSVSPASKNGVGAAAEGSGTSTTKRRRRRGRRGRGRGKRADASASAPVSATEAADSPGAAAPEKAEAPQPGAEDRSGAQVNSRTGSRPSSRSRSGRNRSVRSSRPADADSLPAEPQPTPSRPAPSEPEESRLASSRPAPSRPAPPRPAPPRPAPSPAAPPSRESSRPSESQPEPSPSVNSPSGESSEEETKPRRKGRRPRRIVRR